MGHRPCTGVGVTYTYTSYTSTYTNIHTCVPEQEFMGISEAIGLALGSGCSGYVTSAGVLILVIALPLGLITWLLLRWVCVYTYMHVPLHVRSCVCPCLASESDHIAAAVVSACFEMCIYIHARTRTHMYTCLLLFCGHHVNLMHTCIHASMRTYVIYMYVCTCI